MYYVLKVPSTCSIYLLNLETTDKSQYSKLRHFPHKVNYFTGMLFKITHKVDIIQPYKHYITLSKFKT